MTDIEPSPEPQHSAQEIEQVPAKRSPFMADLSRRAFLVRGSLGLAAVGAMSAAPGFMASATTAESDLPAVEDATSTALPTAEAAVPAMDQPLVAHIKDIQTGEMSLFMGTQEITYKDPLLAARLVSAATK